MISLYMAQSFSLSPTETLSKINESVTGSFSCCYFIGTTGRNVSDLSDIQGQNHRGMLGEGC